MLSEFKYAITEDREMTAKHPEVHHCTSYAGLSGILSSNSLWATSFLALDVRSLLGVMSGELGTSKGIVSTTSDFAPKIRTDPFIAPFLPYRLELMNGEELRKWLASLIE